MIYSNRTVLTPIASSDFQDILEMFEDDDALQYIPHLHKRDVKYYEDYLNDKMEIIAQKKGYYWVVRMKEDGDFLGCINVTPISTSDNRIQIGWITRREYWKKGLASEAVNAVFTYSKEELRFTEIYGFYEKDNVASQRIFDRLGFKHLDSEKGLEVRVWRRTNPC